MKRWIKPCDDFHLFLLRVFDEMGEEDIGTKCLDTMYFDRLGRQGPIKAF